MSFISFFNRGKPDKHYDTYPDAVIVLNNCKAVSYWNKKAEKIFGFSKEEVLEQNISFIFYNGIDKIYQCVTEDRNAIVSARSKTGEELFVEIRASENKHETIITARDVTRTHKIIGSLLHDYETEKVEKVKKAGFIFNFRHEIANPLQAILGFSQALIDKLGGELTEKQDKYMQIINKNAFLLLKLMNNILDITKYDADKFDIEYKTFDVINLVNSVVDAVMPSIVHKKLQFSSDLTSIDKRTCYSDEKMIGKAILSVLDNAVKFTESGNINLKLSNPDTDFLVEQGLDVPKNYTDKSYIMVKVEDTGIGIAENRLNDIFDEHRDMDKNIIKKYGGTGLSLAITRKIIEELNGIIWVESEINKGARFVFVVPIEEPNAKILEDETKKTEPEVSDDDTIEEIQQQNELPVDENKSENE